MRIVLVILSVVFAVGAGMVTAAVKSDIQIILVVLLFASAIIFFALATILAEVIHLRQDLDDIANR